MAKSIEGGCLCGKLRYRATTSPLWVTVCYCRFCQRATGSDRMIEPIFERKAVSFFTGDPAVYTLPSEGSGKDIQSISAPTVAPSWRLHSNAGRITLGCTREHSTIRPRRP